MFDTTFSRDGTRIAFEARGSGAAIVMVTGAFNDRSTAAALADCLASRFTTITYDRRGRGDSGDTLPYTVEREIEDLAALLEVAGGSAGVFGSSCGALVFVRGGGAG